MEYPDFEIHQIKMKVGMVRIYLGTKIDLRIPDEKICSEISKLQKLLSCPESAETPVRMNRKKREPSRKQ